MEITVFAVAANAKTTRNPNYKIEVNTYYDDKAIFAAFASEQTAREWMESYQIDGEIVALTGKIGG